MKLTLLLAAVVLMGLTVSLACAQKRGGNDPTALKGKAAPDFSLATFAGQNVKLSDQKGKVVVVDFWATWCPPCRKSLPHIQAMSADQELAGKGLVVWAVNARETKDIVGAFMKSNNFTFTVPMDADGKAMAEYMVSGIPTTVVVGRDGNVKDVFVGFGDGSAKLIDDAVKAALGEK